MWLPASICGQQAYADGDVKRQHAPRPCAAVCDPSCCHERSHGSSVASMRWLLTSGFRQSVCVPPVACGLSNVAVACAPQPWSSRAAAAIQMAARTACSGGAGNAGSRSR